MSVTVEPLWSQILMDLEPEPELSSVIHVQNQLEGLCRTGRVTAVGPEVRDVKVGERILASITAGYELPQGMLVSESAVLGHLHEAHP